MSEQAQAATFSPGTQDCPLHRMTGLELHELGDQLVVGDVSADRAHFLNASIAAIWKLCDGTRSADQIARRLAETFDCSQAEGLGRTVEEALETLAGLDLLSPAHG